MSNLLFPEVLSMFTYSSRAKWGAGVKGFFEGSNFGVEVSMVLRFWGWGVLDWFWGGKEVWQFWACPVFQYLKHCPSFMYSAHLTGVSFDRVTMSTSMVLGSYWGWGEKWDWGGTWPTWRARIYIFWAWKILAWSIHPVLVVGMVAMERIMEVIFWSNLRENWSIRLISSLDPALRERFWKLVM